jgi:hypothetical protein
MFLVGVIGVVVVGVLAATVYVLRAERQWVDERSRADQRYDR